VTLAETEYEVRLTKLRLALMEVDKIAVSHTKNGIGKAQAVARQAIDEDDQLKGNNNASRTYV
jgi:hypothetical protein